ncbi:helix-turn-helix domain-containing protein [Tropicibacter sp. Alg240-R139]|uniref:helix-turn-helix domain-containing protein n=1 Tax=Tropicibacter sp. Alg240-R139 TaxID=2305991 RepID=UPI0013E01A7B|nr:helix-turn-helix domain-containing protein [Tropicibacter sp. Alg240-R139]
MTNIAALSNSCMPGYVLSANPGLIWDAHYNDFDAQAQRLVGHDQSYVQLTPGAFEGRFLSCTLGPDVAIHIEHCNQALEQQVTGHSTALSIGVAIQGGQSFLANGERLSVDDILFIPPDADLHLLSPVNGSVLAITVQDSALCGFSELSDPLQSYLHQTPEVQILRNPQLARRIREDVVQAVEGCNRSECSPQEATRIGHALLTGLFAKLAIDLCAIPGGDHGRVRQSYDRFMACRDAILRDWEQVHDLDALTDQTGIKRRSLQQAFTSHVAAGPLTYHRIIRLHLVRRALLDEAAQADSIGDIAARFGFWNWSQFTQHYRGHFGEVPSQTRALV